MAIFLGIDLGTSGCRVVAIDQRGRALAELTADWSTENQTPDLWWTTACKLIHSVAACLPADQIRALAVDGTSSTLLLCDKQGRPLGPVLMYHDSRARKQAETIAAIMPRDYPVHSPSSSLAKLLYLQQQPQAQQACYALHQADWINAKLCGRFGYSDENNCLKLGYDVRQRCWPDCLDMLGVRRTLLPEVVPPGTILGLIQKSLAQQLGLPPATRIVAGTTDGVAAFLASGASQPGEAVSSLGSTLVIKVLSDRYLSDWHHGIYSHRLDKLWLVGGASNCGGAVLLQYFTRQALAAMTPRLQAQQPTGLDYYPLPATGERFPVNDPDKQAVLTPRPADEVRFFQAILEGIAAVEAEGYRQLTKHGAPWPTIIRTVGGGAVNRPWMMIRQRLLQVPVTIARHQQAAFGAALLAQKCR